MTGPNNNFEGCIKHKLSFEVGSVSAYLHPIPETNVLRWGAGCLGIALPGVTMRPAIPSNSTGGVGQTQSLTPVKCLNAKVV